MKLEELQPEAIVCALVPDVAVTVISLQWRGSEALPLVCQRSDGRVEDEILYRDDNSRVELVDRGRPWRFDGNGALSSLVSEAHQLRPAHFINLVLAVHTNFPSSPYHVLQPAEHSFPASENYASDWLDGR